jgi:hypothetical protein
MRSAGNEVARVINIFGKQYIEQQNPNGFILKTLDALQKCRTSALGGHLEKCDSCNHQRVCYNSCRDRHCPKCQSAKQAFWVEDRMKDALNVKYFHVVFTVPHELNTLCLLNSAWFYNALFTNVWHTLQQFGYSHYGVESGAICVLHTWGQNLSLHPHVHCLVPAGGITLKGNFKPISKNGKYLYPQAMLSTVFRGKMMGFIKLHLAKEGLLHKYQALLDQAWAKPWVVDCEPPFGSPEHIVKYLGQYTHRVAISNHRIVNITEQGVDFTLKDYADGGKHKTTHLSGVEFLRRFAMHILPFRFVRIRYYGILSSPYRKRVNHLKKKDARIQEPPQLRLLRLTGFDVGQCPICKTGRMHVVDILPKIRGPDLHMLRKNNKSA